MCSLLCVVSLKDPTACGRTESIPAEESQGPKQSLLGKCSLLLTHKGKCTYQIGHFLSVGKR